MNRQPWRRHHRKRPRRGDEGDRFEYNGRNDELGLIDPPRYPYVQNYYPFVPQNDYNYFMAQYPTTNPPRIHPYMDMGRILYDAHDRNVRGFVHQYPMGVMPDPYGRAMTVIRQDEVPYNVPQDGYHHNNGGPLGRRSRLVINEIDDETAPTPPRITSNEEDSRRSWIDSAARFLWDWLRSLVAPARQRKPKSSSDRTGMAKIVKIGLSIIKSFRAGKPTPLFTALGEILLTDLLKVGSII